MTKGTRSTLIGAVALVTAFAAGAAYLLRDPLPHFRERRSSLATVRESVPRIERGYLLQSVRLTAHSGVTFDLVVRRAIEDSGRRLPVAILLGGHRTGADAAKLVGDYRGVVLAGLSYPYSGSVRPDAMTFLKQIPMIRRAFLDTPPALMLALDYLLQRPDVDPGRAEVVGVSLGAPFVCIAGALDSRFARVWAVHGSGGSYAPLELSMRRTIKYWPLRIPAAALATMIIAGPRLDPVRWVPSIAPRPFVMVNASDDERMPRAKVDALFRSARNPKEIVWMSGKHVRGDAATIQQLVAIVLPRVREWTQSKPTRIR